MRGGEGERDNEIIFVTNATVLNDNNFICTLLVLISR